MLEIIDMGKYKIYSLDKSLQILSDLEKEGATLYGIDGIFVHPHDKFQPSMENSVNYSSRFIQPNIFTCSKTEIYEYAREFLRKNAQPGLYFEIVSS